MSSPIVRKGSQDLHDISVSKSTLDSADQTAARQTGRVRNRSDYDLTKAGDVESFLKNHRGLKNFQLQALRGGTANYVYRLTGHGETEAKKWVLKHATGSLASDPSFNLPQGRMNFEAKILANKTEGETECRCARQASSLYDLKIDHTHVHAAPLIFYEEDMKLLCIEDAGSRNLKDAYMELSKDEVQEIGEEIGEWLAKLHAETPKSNVAGELNLNNKVGEFVARHTYSNLSTIFEQTGHDAKLGKTINDRFGELIASDDEGVCHGDFWPGNIMLQSTSPSEGPYLLTVIDWETVRVGSSATDVGQFAAEVFLLDRFYGGKGLHAAFIRSYFEFRADRTCDREWLRQWMTRVAVHFAAHLAYWPSHTVHWANKDDTKPVLDMSVAVLEDVLTSTPDPMSWKVFDGVPGLRETVKGMMAEQGVDGADSEDEKRPLD